MSGDAATIVRKTIEKAAPLIGKRHYAGVISAAAGPLAQAIAKQQLSAMTKKKVGAPTRYTKKLGDEICRRVQNAETLPAISRSLGVDLRVVYDWLEDQPEFAQHYNRSKKLMAKTLVENLVDEVSTLQNDQALAARVKSDLVKWVAARYNPEDFADTRRLELKGEVTHTHIHQLEDHQKRKIAEAWLMSQQTDDSPGIVAETTGPDLEGVAVREICEDEQGIVPKRKRSATPQLPKPQGKRGRKAKLDLDKPIDSECLL